MKLIPYSVFISLGLWCSNVGAEVGQADMLHALSGEFYIQEQKYAKAFKQYEKLAKKQNTPKVLKRLFDISLAIGDLALVEKASVKLIKQDPEDVAANQNYLIALVGQNKFEAATGQIKRLYKVAKSKDMLLEVMRKLSLVKHKNTIKHLLSDLSASIKADKEDLYALAVYYSLVNDFIRSKASIDKAIALDTTWAKANILKSRILYTEGKLQEAITYIEKFYTQNQSSEAGAVYARMLAGSNKLDAAIKIYEKVIKQKQTAEIQDALAGLYANTKQYSKARSLYLKLVDNLRFGNKANYYLGLIAKEQKDNKLALKYFGRVRHGEHYLDARLNMALILGEDKVEDGIAFLDALRADNLKSYSRVVSTRAEIYKEAGDFKKAYEVYSKAIDEHFMSELLYERAILAEKMGFLESMEEDFLTIIENDPDDADALNALGYSLADKTDRLLEALSYIERALSLEPNKFYILDSMGWVQYKLGSFEKALQYLLKAYQQYQDPEIAAHLGEVYLHTGDSAQAVKYFKSGKELNAEHPAIIKLQRLLKDKGINH